VKEEGDLQLLNQNNNINNNNNNNNNNNHHHHHYFLPAKPKVSRVAGAVKK
jgi:hypothetical protein